MKMGAGGIVPAAVNTNACGEGAGGRPILHAYDKRTGDNIAEIAMPGTQTAVPMSYMYLELICSRCLVSRSQRPVRWRAAAPDVIRSLRRTEYANDRPPPIKWH